MRCRRPAVRYRRVLVVVLVPGTSTGPGSVELLQQGLAGPDTHPGYLDVSCRAISVDHVGITFWQESRQQNKRRLGTLTRICYLCDWGYKSTFVYLPVEEVRVDGLGLLM